jgi:hypothetical protein
VHACDGLTFGLQRYFAVNGLDVEPKKKKKKGGRMNATAAERIKQRRLDEAGRFSSACMIPQGAKN